MQNRLGFTNFVEDKKKIDEYYEMALEHEHCIMMLDHLFIALVSELGKDKEVEIKENLKEIEQLKKDRDYWMKSFKKQVEASRGGYQPIKQNDSEPLNPPKAE